MCDFAAAKIGRKIDVWYATEFMRKLRLFLSFLLSAYPAFSWGPEGHNLVARLAAAHLNPAAAAQVKAILGPGASLASVSSWADQVRNSRRETAPWHFIDIPITQPHLDMTRDCPKGDCVIAKIEDFRKVLADAAAAPEHRNEALRFLVHFVGDMHQPLHCADNNDRGGNEVRVDFFGRNMNLHSVWDSGLLGRMPPEDQLFAQLSKHLTEGRARKLGKGGPRDWAEEIHKTAVKVIYGKLPKTVPVTITADYEKIADAVVKQQLERAGARLAATLNAALK